MWCARSPRMPWFEGPALLEYLENLPVARRRSRRPVALSRAIRDPPGRDVSAASRASRFRHASRRRDRRGAAFRREDQSEIASSAFDDELEAAGPGASVNVTLEDEIDISRGDMLVDEEKRPVIRHGISGHGRLDACRAARPAQDLPAEAHHAHRARARQADSPPHRREHARKSPRPPAST